MRCGKRGRHKLPNFSFSLLSVKVMTCKSVILKYIFKHLIQMFFNSNIQIKIYSIVYKQQ